jgi:hypothetical protein
MRRLDEERYQDRSGEIIWDRRQTADEGGASRTGNFLISIHVQDSFQIALMEPLSSLSLLTGLVAVLCGVAGVILLIEKERALLAICVSLWSVALVLGIFFYLIPQYIRLLDDPLILKVVSTLLLSSVGLGVTFRITGGSMFVVLLFGISLVTYELMSVVWHLTPAYEWEQVKILFSVISGASLSTVVMNHTAAASKVFSFVIGSLLIATSIECFSERIPPTRCLQVCLGELGEDGHVSAHCMPFVLSFLVAIVTTFMLEGLSQFRKLSRADNSPNEDQYTAIRDSPAPHTLI